MSDIKFKDFDRKVMVYRKICDDALIEIRKEQHRPEDHLLINLLETLIKRIDFLEDNFKASQKEQIDTARIKIV